MKLTMKALLLRGAAAGAVAGVATALFVRIVTETHVGHALLFEDASGFGLGPGEPPLYDRAAQHLGGMAAALIYGIVLGVVVSVVFGLLRHRLTGPNEFNRIAKLSAVAFLATSLIPGLKYPPNPPTVGDPDTIGDRTASYLLLMVVSVLIVSGAFILWQWLTTRGLDGASRFAATAAAFAAMVTVAFLVFPATPDPINPPDNEAGAALVIAADAPADVLDQVLATAKATGDESIRDKTNPDEPFDLSSVTSGADLRGAPVRISTTKLVPHAYTTILWHFRAASFGGIALLWVVMAAAFGFLVDRLAADENALGVGAS